MSSRFKRWLGALACVALFGIIPLAAASNISPWFARTWLTEHGLPDNNVTGVAQSAEGYLWISTHNGLARFDGARFDKISLPKVSGRSDLLIRTLLLTDNNSLWLAAESGVVMQLTPNATNVFTTADGLSNFRPMVLARENNGTVWVGYSDGSACEIAQGKVRRIFGLPGTGQCWLTADTTGQIWFAKAGRVGLWRTNQFVTLLTLPETDVRLHAVRDGGIWIAAGLRLLKFQEGGSLVPVGQITPDRAGVKPSILFEDKPGALWVGTSDGGLFRFDGTNALPVDTSHTDILSIEEDREGSLWVGTGGGGLNRLRPRVLELQGVESGLPGESIRSVCQDITGNVWVTAQNGGLVQSRNGTWKIISKSKIGLRARATCVASDGQGGVWVGTSHAGLAHWQDGKFTFLQQRDGLASQIAHALLLDRRGDLWIGLESTNCLQRLSQGRFTTFTQPPGSRTIRALAEDAAGKIWAGTSDGFLFRMNGDKLVDETPHTVSPLFPIRCLFAPTDGGLWIGYAGGGIGWLRDGKFGRVSQSQGLYDDGICEIMADTTGSLWLGSDHRIFQVNTRELQQAADGKTMVRSIVYGRDEALPNLQASYGFTPGALRSRDGRIWLPMRTGLAVVHPNRVRANRIPPLVQIEQMTVDGHAENLALGAGLRLPPQQRKVEFKIAVLSFIAPENVRWKYRLDGVDDDWTDGGSQRMAVYPQLAAGHYRFHVITANSAGVWNEQGATLAFTVTPFYWQTWWFRVAVLLAFTFGVAAVVRYVSFRRLRTRLARLEQETALQRDRARIAQDLHDDLGASLTHIALLSELAQNDFEQPPQARRHIDDIFRTARAVTRSLDEIVWSVSPKNDALDRFVAHLATYAPDFLRAAGVRARLDLPADLPALDLPSEVRHHLYLTVKESLHNIVKHAGATEVWLRLGLTSTTLTLIIEDDGRGCELESATTPDADGLANFRQRMNEIDGRCELSRRPGGGTVLTFTVPLTGEIPQ
jgi:ligand-binding sensor domain-containing protein/signal transduction histidine kinase